MRGRGCGLKFIVVDGEMHRENGGGWKASFWPFTVPHNRRLSARSGRSLRNAFKHYFYGKEKSSKVMMSHRYHALQRYP